MFKKTLALLVVALVMTVGLIEAQNITIGRWPSDAGPAVFNYGTATDTTAQDMTAAAGAGVFNYIYQAACFSTSATVAVAILKSGSTAIAAVPCVPSGGFSQPIVFVPPLKMPAANTKLTMTASTSITTAYFYSAARTAR